MAEKMIELVSQQDGFLGFESAREALGITVSYWRDEQSILKWKADIEHQKAQKTGKELWYKHYKIRIAKVERDCDNLLL
jgi:heme-degrading monooxygenase HmoA